MPCSIYAGKKAEGCVDGCAHLGDLISISIIHAWIRVAVGQVGTSMQPPLYQTASSKFVSLGPCFTQQEGQMGSSWICEGGVHTIQNRLPNLSSRNTRCHRKSRCWQYHYLAPQIGNRRQCIDPSRVFPLLLKFQRLTQRNLGTQDIHFPSPLLQGWRFILIHRIQNVDTEYDFARFVSDIDKQESCGCTYPM